MKNQKLVYRVSDLCDLLDIGKNSAYRLVHSEDFPKIIVGKKILIPKKAFEEWLDNNSSIIV
ncbi:MAG: helix-turn-helix domain-containing protein [Clostridiaceae bacterium]|nr:helix-turn-helix domain-containing protein [Clostridiaceae bacterium]